MRKTETTEPIEAINQSILSDKKRMANFMCKLPEEKEWDVGVYGIDADDAAEEYAKYCWDNRDGWEWLRSGSIVECRSIATGEVTRHSIEAKSQPVFSACQQ